MPPRLIVWQQLVALLITAAVAAGCTVQLVPAYDRTIVDGLTTANQETMELFASVSGGVPADTYAQREETYNQLIGSFDALRMQAAARPVPQPLFLQWLGISSAEGKQPDEIQRLQNPTPEVLETVRDTLTRMRDTDQAGRLSATQVSLFKNSYELSIDQALTVEKALER